MGKFFVRKNENNRDAQAMWGYYVVQMSTSTTEDLEIESLMEKLTSMRFTNSNNGTNIDLYDLDRLHEEI